MPSFCTEHPNYFAMLLVYLPIQVKNFHGDVQQKKLEKLEDVCFYITSICPTSKAQTRLVTQID